MEHYFSSDYHFKHKNVLHYDNRPFSSIEEHDETIIKNHNERVKPEDHFYFLGDLALGSTKAQWIEMLNRMNGKKFFIKGNHDSKDHIAAYKQCGTYLGNLDEIKIGEQRIVLCHYAMLVWNRSHHGSWMLYGHSHHSLPVDPNSLRLDVGINGTNYYPLSFEDIREELSKRTFQAIDHHS